MDCRTRVSLWLVFLSVPFAQLHSMAQQPMPYGQPGPQSVPYQASPSQGNPYPQQYGPNDSQGYGQPQYPPPQPYPQQGYPQQNEDAPGYSDQYPQQDDGQQPAPVQALTTPQLEQLVAPIALYPDTLVAQVLAAATYPAQVVDADHWRQAQGNVPPDQIVYGADAQNWDPSVKALTAFPQVLSEMDQNIRWTMALGNAYYNQPQDVLDTIQLMRQRAEAAGNLQNTPQEAMTYDQGNIQLASANPSVVYLPAYNPWGVYGAPVQPYPGFSLIGALGSFFGSSPVRYGVGIAISAFTHTSWGWLGWGVNWLTHSLLFNNSSYYSHSTSVRDWGLPHGGPRAGFQRGGAYSYAHLSENGYRGYRPSSGYNRPSVASNDHRPYGEDNRSAGYEQGYARPENRLPESRYSENRLPQNRLESAPYRGNSAPGQGYGRPPMESYNRVPQPVAHPDHYGSLGSRSEPGGYGQGTYRPDSYGGGSYGAFSPRQYASRPAPSFGNPSQSYRPPASSYQRAESGERYSGFSRGSGGYSGKPQNSGGFHMFGGGSHEPKAPKPPKISSHEHGGGHSGGHGGGWGHHR